MVISNEYVNFVRNYIKDRSAADQCVKFINTALKYSTHLVRVSNVARTAGFCAFYGRMAEKMGVYEISVGKYGTGGRNIHAILGLASLNLFMENPTATGDQVKANAEKYVRSAVENLEDFLNFEDRVIEAATHLLKRLGEALSSAKLLLGLRLNDPLFPIVEQTLIDYRFRMYGVPDLILENMEKRRAIVVEWKSYNLDDKSGSANEFEIAQVIAYSILEARRLGFREAEEILECITGIRLRANNKSSYKSDEELQHDIAGTNDTESIEPLKILPLIITPSGGFPPHPYMYKRVSGESTRKRFERISKLFEKVIIAAEHLTLQIINIPELLRIALGIEYDRLNTELKNACTSNDGYPAYSIVPGKYLRYYRPGNWNRYPCKMCQFRGEKGPCAFYFGSNNPKDYFDKLMWWARYKVYWKRERDLVNHRAMYELFESPLARHTMRSNEPIKFELDIGSGECRIAGKDALIYLIQVKRGSQNLGKFRFDYFKVSDAEFDENNNIIELKRDVRKVEIARNVKAFLRKSLQLTIIDPNNETVINPLMSISTFVMIDDAFIDSDKKITYRLYNPSPVLQFKFMIFGKYLEWYKRNKRNAKLLAYETPVDLTIMELRTIDALHRYLKRVDENHIKALDDLKQHHINNIEEKDLIEEAEIIKRYIRRSESTITHALRSLLYRRIVAHGN